MTPNQYQRSGVYVFVNKVDNKRYVGSSTCLIARKRGHLKRLVKGNHHSIHFQRAWDKYGADSFCWKVLEFCTPEQCVPREQYYIDKFRAANPRYGYNRNPYSSSTLGMVWTLASRQKMLGNTNSTGRVLTEEHKTKIAQSMRGKVLTAAHRSKLSAAKVGKPAHNRGKATSEEVKKKISEAKKGKQWSQARHNAQRRK